MSKVPWGRVLVQTQLSQTGLGASLQSGVPAEPSSCRTDAACHCEGRVFVFIFVLVFFYLSVADFI